MALIPCPKCGHQISERAQACPHCGYAKTAGVAQRTPRMDSAPLSSPSYARDQKSDNIQAAGAGVPCQRCGFTSAWDGHQCRHCGYIAASTAESAQGTTWQTTGTGTTTSPTGNGEKRDSPPAAPGVFGPIIGLMIVGALYLLAICFWGGIKDIPTPVHGFLWISFLGACYSIYGAFDQLSK
jgi:uncharacterized membrane protein YvbJ